MRGAALLLLPACIAVAGCGGGGSTTASTGNSEMQAQAAGRAVDPEQVMAERWQSVFADPARTIAVANEFGYRAGGYAATGKGYGATGAQQVLPDPKAPIVVATNFSATGAKASRVDAIGFSFDVKQLAKPTNKKELDAARIPDRIVRGFLQRFQVGPGDAVREAVNGRTPTEVELHGVTIKVAAEPLPGGKNPADRRMTVTFTNSEAQASS